MRIRHKEYGFEAESHKFNIHGLGEIMVYTEEEVYTDYMKDYEVFIKARREWITFRKAFDSKAIITDNYNEHFFEPSTEEDRERGYTLY